MTGVQTCALPISDGVMVLATEGGVLNLSSKKIVKYGQLRTQSFIMLDMLRGRVLHDGEVRSTVLHQAHSPSLSRQHFVALSDLHSKDTRYTEHQQEPPNDRLSYILKQNIGAKAHYTLY